MNRISQDELDWLVEGEMSRGERDDLMARMDHDPDAWKRCAIAFMERDALGHSFRKLDLLDQIPSSGEIDEPTESPLTRPANRLKNRVRNIQPDSVRHWAVVVVIAGLMFVSGYVLSGVSQPVGRSVDVETVTDVASNRDMSGPGSNRAIQRQVVLQASQTMDRLNLNDATVIALLATGQDAEQRVIPVLQSETLTAKLNSLPPIRVPGPLAKNLIDSGYRVQPNRQFLSIENEKGESDLIPMNMLNCQFVGKSIF